MSRQISNDVEMIPTAVSDAQKIVDHAIKDIILSCHQSQQQSMASSAEHNKSRHL